MAPGTRTAVTSTPASISLCAYSLPLVAQHIKFGDGYEGRRQPSQLSDRGMEWRRMRVQPQVVIWKVLVPEPLHVVFGQEVSVTKLAIRESIEVRVRGWIEEDLCPDRRATPLRRQ